MEQGVYCLGCSVQGLTIDPESKGAANAREQARPKKRGMPNEPIKAETAEQAIDEPCERRAADAKRHECGKVSAEDGDLAVHGQLLHALAALPRRAVPA
jgi:hypothetical protein